jgi:ribonucleoside-diphosphate reductase alpha chain
MGSETADGVSAIGGLEGVINDKIALESHIAALECEVTALRAKADRPVRRRMPETRVALNHKFEIVDHKGYLTVGMFEDGQPGEIFIQMNKEGSTIGGLMDTVATLTSMALQYGVPLQSLVKKFAYQRFEPSGFTKNPDIRHATSITDYVFRWLGCQFIKGFKEATSPNKAQAELPMKELGELDKKALNRPVADLPRERADVIDVITHKNGSEGEPHLSINGHTHAERVQEALGNMYMDITCSNCGSSKVIRAGACGCCTECGTSQGCS